MFLNYYEDQTKGLLSQDQLIDMLKPISKLTDILGSDVVKTSGELLTAILLSSRDFFFKTKLVDGTMAILNNPLGITTLKEGFSFLFEFSENLETLQMEGVNGSIPLLSKTSLLAGDVYKAIYQNGSFVVSVMEQRLDAKIVNRLTEVEQTKEESNSLIETFKNSRSPSTSFIEKINTHKNILLNIRAEIMSLKDDVRFTRLREILTNTDNDVNSVQNTILGFVEKANTLDQIIESQISSINTIEEACEYIGVFNQTNIDPKIEYILDSHNTLLNDLNEIEDMSKWINNTVTESGSLDFITSLKRKCNSIINLHKSLYTNFVPENTLDLDGITYSYDDMSGIINQKISGLSTNFNTLEISNDLTMYDSDTPISEKIDDVSTLFNPLDNSLESIRERYNDFIAELDDGGLIDTLEVNESLTRIENKIQTIIDLSDGNLVNLETWNRAQALIGNLETLIGYRDQIDANFNQFKDDVYEASLLLSKIQLSNKYLSNFESALETSNSKLNVAKEKMLFWKILNESNQYPEGIPTLSEVIDRTQLSKPHVFSGKLNEAEFKHSLVDVMQEISSINKIDISFPNIVNSFHSGKIFFNNLFLKNDSGSYDILGGKDKGVVDGKIYYSDSSGSFNVSVSSVPKFIALSSSFLNKSWTNNIYIADIDGNRINLMSIFLGIYKRDINNNIIYGAVGDFTIGDFGTAPTNGKTTFYQVPKNTTYLNKIPFLEEYESISTHYNEYDGIIAYEDNVNNKKIYCLLDDLKELQHLCSGGVLKVWIESGLVNVRRVITDSGLKDSIQVTDNQDILPFHGKVVLTDSGIISKGFILDKNGLIENSFSSDIRIISTMSSSHSLIEEDGKYYIDAWYGKNNTEKILLGTESIFSKIDSWFINSLSDTIYFTTNDTNNLYRYKIGDFNAIKFKDMGFPGKILSYNNIIILTDYVNMYMLDPQFFILEDVGPVPEKYRILPTICIFGDDVRFYKGHLFIRENGSSYVESLFDLLIPYFKTKFVNE